MIFETSKRWFIILAIALCVLTLGAVLWNAHYKVITEGEFNGLVIGQSKQETFKRLQENQKFERVDPRLTPSETVEIQNNPDDVSLLVNAGKIHFEGPDLSFRVYSTKGEITLFYYSYLFEQKVGFGNLSTEPEQFFAQIQDLMRQGVITSARTDGSIHPNSLGYQVISTLNNGDEHPAKVLEWLFSFNMWVFREEGAYKFYYIYFADGKLVRIEYWNDFVEMP